MNDNVVGNFMDDDLVLTYDHLIYVISLISIDKHHNLKTIKDANKGMANFRAFAANKNSLASTV